MRDCVIECKNVKKSFNGVKVLDDVHFDAYAGEILVLLGEHRAGKSTLMNIMTGVYHADEGSIYIDGKIVNIDSMKKAQRLGVSAIFKKLNLFPHLSVADNIFIMRSPMRLGFIYDKQMHLNAQKILNELGIDIPTHAVVGTLSIAQQRFVEIAKALATGVRVLILDDPASILTANETEELFAILLRLRDERKIGIVYLCHRVDELLHMADRVAVMKNGSIVKSAAYSDFTMEEFISFVGMQYFAESISETRTLAKTIVNAFSKKDRQAESLSDEEMVTSLQELLGSLRQLPSRAQEYEAREHHRLMAMRDFTDAFSVMVDLLAERYQALLEAKSEAEAASRFKSVFLATMSHEIRTPLNAIIGLSEIQLHKQLPAGTRLDLEKILRSGSTLLGIINDILDISKIESGSFELVPAEYDAAKMIDDVVQLNIVRIGSKNITFELRVNETVPSKFYGDELRVKQILNNLLTNAFKYTKEGKVSLRIDWHREGKSAKLAFGVDDTGVGIKEEDLKRLFSEYTQLDTRTNRSIEGTGLGLSIAKNLAEMMGGAVTVQSVYGSGSTFNVYIWQEISDVTPIGQEVARDLENRRYISHGGGKEIIPASMPNGRVLVVDDVPTNLDVAKGLMLPYGLTIDFAGSGREAIEKIRSGNVLYDIVFMDHMMPEMDGIEATRVIRNEIGTDYAKTVPIVVLTANALIGNKEMFLENGFNDFLSKPVDVAHLDTVLNQWLEWRVEAPSEGGALKPDTLRGRHVQGVDLLAGAARYNSEAVYLNILRSFVTHTPGSLLKLRKLAKENLAEYSIVVHGIKGASYGLCADAVGERAEFLEHASKAADIESVRSGNESFVKLVETLIAEVKELLREIEESSAVGPKARLSSPDAVLLQKFLDYLRHFNLTKMEEIMGELAQYDYDSCGELVTWLKEKMDDLEYDVMRVRLEEFLKNTECATTQ